MPLIAFERPESIKNDETCYRHEHSNSASSVQILREFGFNLQTLRRIHDKKLNFKVLKSSTLIFDHFGF